LVSDLRQNVSPFDQPKYRKLGEKIRDITISKEKKNSKRRMPASDGSHKDGPAQSIYPGNGIVSKNQQ
jgi:hypothetical protein